MIQVGMARLTNLIDVLHTIHVLKKLRWKTMLPISGALRTLDIIENITGSNQQWQKQDKEI
jgi:hypothetical protein